jgi:hypothetical protein
LASGFLRSAHQLLNRAGSPAQNFADAHAGHAGLRSVDGGSCSSAAHYSICPRSPLDLDVNSDDACLRAHTLPGMVASRRFRTVSLVEKFGREAGSDPPS